jgi:REP element-mobilizing transposase RayT
MVRPLRVEYEDAYYHVMSRGKGRQSVFHGTLYYERFLDCLEQAHKRFALECHAYCLMGNHYHLLVRTPRGNLSRAMRHVNGVYTQYHNYLKKTDGPLFRGRYKAINIEESSYLLEVSRYIHRNPIETKKPLAERLVNYRWSSYPAYLNKAECPDWLYRSAVYEELGSGQPVRSYTRFVEQGNDEETEKFYARDHWPAVRGGEKFADKAYLLSNVDGKEVRKRERKVIFSEAILSAVCERMKCEKKALLYARRGRGVDNRARGMAMKLCLEQGGMKLSEMGKLFNVSSDSAVSRSVSRFDALLDSDLEIAGLYESICQDLTP